MNQACKTINCPNCGIAVEETFVEQKCPRCQTLIDSKFMCGSCHHCGDTVSNNKPSILSKIFSVFNKK